MAVAVEMKRRKRTLAEEAEELRQAFADLGKALIKAWQPFLCRIGLHESSVAHPHYCGACGRYYGLR